MGLFINQQNTRTKLQEKIAADLRAKAMQTQDAQNDKPDGVDDSAYLENTKKTTSLAWAWVLIAIAFVGVIFYMAASRH